MIKMEYLFVFMIIAVVSNETFGLSLRRKRQNNEEVDNLDDRYGGDRPQGRPFRPRPNGGRQDWPQPNQPWDQPGRPWGNGNEQGRPNQQQWGGQTSDQQWGGSGSQPNQPWDNPNQQNPGQQNPGQQNPGQQNPGQQNPTGQQTTQSPVGSTSQSPDLSACILRCPTTPEYNPVCGSNSVTYSNPGKLTCAQACGVNVSLQRSAPCPTTTTAAPAPAS